MTNQSKSDVITDILRQHGTLPVSRIVQEMQLRGIEAKPNNVRSLMSNSFKRFTTLEPGLWQLQDPSLSQAERVLAYNQSRGIEVSSETMGYLQSVDKPRAPGLPLKISEVPPETKGFMERENTINTTEQLPLHRRHKTRAGGVATTKDPRQSPHWSENHRSSEEQRAASQGARPVHQMLPRTRQAKQGLLRAVLQKDPRTPSREKAEAKRAQSAGE